MPTVSSHDVLGPMTWGAGGNPRQRYYAQDSLDLSDARVNSVLFEESGAAGPCSVSAAGSVAAPPSEHSYSSDCPRHSLVSTNGYYGFHQQHGTGPSGPALVDQDCSMDTDTSENNPPVPPSPRPFGGFGGSPSGGSGAFPLGPALQHVWNADADPLRSRGATRKRSLEARGFARGVGGWCDAGSADADDMGDMAGCKRTRPSPPSASDAPDAAQAMTEAPSQAMANQGDSFGMQVSAPSTSEQSHSPALMYELPIHQLPGSTSQLADAMTPRPRCLMGHFI